MTARFEFTDRQVKLMCYMRKADRITEKTGDCAIVVLGDDPGTYDVLAESDGEFGQVPDSEIVYATF